MTLWGRLARSWDVFWFAPGTARNLAVARVGTAATALWLLLSRDLPALSGIPPEFWTAVPWTTRWRYLLFPGHRPLEQALQAVAVVALLGVLVGLWPRVWAFVASVVLYHLAPIEAIIWTNSPYVRGFETPVLVLMALALSPCGDAWSPGALGRPAPAPSWAYRWPVRFIQVQVACIYFFTGYSKLVDVGPGWASAANMQAWMLAFNQGVEAKPFQQPGLWLAASPVLCGVMGVATLVFELGFPAALLGKRIALALILVAVGFHLGIWVMMNITILYLPFLLAFVDWGGAPPPSGTLPSPAPSRARLAGPERGAARTGAR